MTAAAPGSAAPGVVAVLAFGANLGDREATIEAALAELDALDGVALIDSSRLYETVAVKPEGIDFDAPGYLNGVARVRVTIEPLALLAAVNRIEHEHGRVRAERWGDRTLDIDVITYGERIDDDPRLTLPHPRAALRDFVLVPWLELDPDAALPGLGRADARLAALPEGATTVRPYVGEPR